MFGKFILAFLLGSLVQPLAAASVVSDFDDGSLQGWVATGDVAGVTNPGAGGNPGGFVRMVDQAVGDLCWILAPAAYLGNWQEKASLSADLTQISFSGNHYQNVQFILSGPGGSYTKDFGERPPLGAWRTYAVPLEEGAWTRNSGSWEALLDNVTELRISMEFITGDETNGLDNVVLTESYTTTTIGKAKLLTDGTDVVVDGIVTLVTSEFMYIQSEDRSAGIRVKNSFAQTPGDRIQIAGKMATAGGERFLNHGLVYSSTPGVLPRPLVILNREPGGIGASVLDPALGTTQSLKETGLLVKCFGRVSAVGSDGTFTIQDGSALSARVRPANGEPIPTEDSYVVVTGVSSSTGSLDPEPILLVTEAVELVQLPYGRNLVANPGAEEGAGGTGAVIRPIPGWSTLSNFTVLNYGSHISVAESTRIGGGRSSFWGGPNNALSEAYQSIDVSTLALDIDAGIVSAALSSYLAGWQTQGDYIVFTATFFDGVELSLGSISLGPQAGSNQLWVPHETSGSVPAGTRRIEVRMKSVRLAGSDNSGYADNVSLVLSKH